MALHRKEIHVEKKKGGKTNDFNCSQTVLQKATDPYGIIRAEGLFNRIG